ncbi:alpha/beta hydrolase [Microbispora sp. NEAU-D428]|uniref:alpha/beta fold hydrolase n=1 Tax=Microbispora sitophila TaxID=2771537 RepID=UPI001867D84A|nr:alpha/beta hydrolase [Microbispora sitophila]MBE3015118.1 alpha/beta hydrolase [Microbispora sitophila]
MSVTTQLTAPNLTIKAANGITYAYRRFGNTDRAVPPLLFLQHFRGNLDNWHPVLVDAIASEREVILLDNAGVGGSTGTTPRTVSAMAHDALAFVDAAGITRADVLGFSLGGFVAQELTLIRRQLVRRLVLAGTGPQGGRGMHGFPTEQVYESALRDEPTGEDLLSLFFEPTPSSLAKGEEFLQAIFSREADRDQPVSLAARDAQLDAITAWGIPDASRLNRLAGITQPTLVANGDHDVMVPTSNSALLVEHLPNARLSLYPGAGHGFLFQCPAEFADEVNLFLG